jgi:hypothetical protein
MEQIKTMHIQLNGHSFSRLSDKCEICGMGIAVYRGRGRPRCPEKPIKDENDKSLSIKPGGAAA